MFACLLVCFAFLCLYPPVTGGKFQRCLHLRQLYRIPLYIYVNSSYFSTVVTSGVFNYFLFDLTSSKFLCFIKKISNVTKSGTKRFLATTSVKPVFAKFHEKSAFRWFSQVFLALLVSFLMPTYCLAFESLFRVFSFRLTLFDFPFEYGL